MVPARGVGGKVDPLKPDGQVDVSRALQIATAAVDATGLCLFVAFAVLAWAYLQGEAAGLPGVTGAHRRCVLGARVP